MPGELITPFPKSKVGHYDEVGLDGHWNVKVVFYMMSRVKNLHNIRGSAIKDNVISLLPNAPKRGHNEKQMLIFKCSPVLDVNQD